MSLIHGGDITGYIMQYGKPPLDFSANINPFGIPHGVKAAVAAAIENADAYPDPLCRKLVNAISQFEGVPSDCIFCGNGAADIIFRIALALKPRLALIAAPTFAEYEQAADTVGCKIKLHHLKAENDFMLTNSIIEQIDSNTDIVFICNPNNPTGQTADVELVKAIADKCRECAAVLVLDECFADFLDEPLKYTFKPYLNGYGNLIILKAFTKLYGMAGIRLGYCLCSNIDITQQLKKAGQPWAVSSLAQAAGIAALKENDYVKTTRELIKAERKYLYESFCKLGIKVIGSQANYIFFKTDAEDLDSILKDYGILIRSCSNYHGLDNTYYRIAVRTHGENQQLIAAIKHITEIHR